MLSFGEDKGSETRTKTETSGGLGSVNQSAKSVVSHAPPGKNDPLPPLTRRRYDASTSSTSTRVRLCGCPRGDQAV
jgi:hypothetical protein